VTHRRRDDGTPPAAWRRAGWDEVRTPFGLRIVPRGQGWREAAKWALWRVLSWVIGAVILLLGGLWIHAYLARQVIR
jgi:hypothetical protein